MIGRQELLESLESTGAGNFLVLGRQLLELPKPKQRRTLFCPWDLDSSKPLVPEDADHQTQDPLEIISPVYQHLRFLSVLEAIDFFNILKAVIAIYSSLTCTTKL